MPLGRTRTPPTPKQAAIGFAIAALMAVGLISFFISGGPSAGHNAKFRAGWDWADENAIYDAKQCKGHGHSKSFVEGCTEWAEGWDKLDAEPAEPVKPAP
jgi:hypothetical protein